MNFRRAREREEIDINLIPLIDILIVVLIFLFLTTTYSKYAELQINLPEAAAERAAEKPQTLNVAVDAAGKYAINGVATAFGSTQAFSQAMREAAKGAREPIVAISADAAAKHQDVVNVMESARLAGYNHISFTTQRR
ncbi:MAG TPA: biopolymer transporter ExbD [Usitatibacter sp.]|jgi:biopolymer transport protein ExbD|nr:biopolymer transporter ExbD [Usitatibacter sp.]